MKYIVEVNNQNYEVEINQDNQIVLNGEPRVVDFYQGASHGVFSLIIDNQSYEAIVEERDGKYHVLILGSLYEVDVEDERARRLAAASGSLKGGTGDSSVRSPMPGLIVDIPLQEGDEVEQGQTVVILESMKMQNELKAPQSGVISKVNVAVGDNVEQNKVLVIVHSED